jgi:osmoprotectant transport system substrate-binding protein
MKHTPRLLRLLAATAATALLISACGGDGGDEGAAGDETERGTIVVGSADFDENEIVAAMYTAVLEDAGYTVETNYAFGNRETYFAALESGELDLVPEYVGTAVEFLTSGAGEATGDTEETTERLRELVAEQGLEVLEPADAENKNGFVVTQETAEEHSLAAVSDLEPVAGELTLGGPPECPERPLCIIGLREVYGVEFGTFQPLDVGGPVTVRALEGGDIDVALLFTTDESIGINDWVLLDDDQDLQPAENLAPVIRQEVLDDEIRSLLDAVSAELTTEELTELNRRVRFDGEDPADVAEAWLDEKGLLAGS